MVLKLKTLVFCVFAALACSAAIGAVAGAETTGHFTSSSPSGKTTLTGSEEGSHGIEFSSADLSGFAEPIHCTNATYHGSFTGETTQQLTLTPSFSGCTTTAGDEVTVTSNECDFHLYSRSSGEATGELHCPTGKKVEVHDPETGCKLKFGTQKIASALIYKTDTLDGKHSLTVEVTASKISFEAHGGLCVFVVTNHSDGALTGSATLYGADPDNCKEVVSITST